MLKELNKYQVPVNDLLRNNNRVLNHYNLISEKIDIIDILGLNSCNKSKNNLDLLLALNNNDLKVVDIIKELSHRINNYDTLQISNLLKKTYRTGHLEIHLTDVCDLDCIDCHYRSKNQDTIPFNKLDSIVSSLSPHAITITGGGEPNYYSSNGKNISDAILLIKTKLPNTSLGLINNNTKMQAGNWLNSFKWQRSSLDAATPETYFKIKRKDKFFNVIENTKNLLNKSEIPYIGIGFLYRNENAHEIFDFLNYWYKWLSGESSINQKRFNIQFRPLSPDINEVISMKINKPELLISTENVVKQQVLKVINQKSNDLNFNKFIISNTNFNSSFPSTDIVDPFFHKPSFFDKCYNSLSTRIFRADGTEYPDFLLCNEPRYCLGNTFLEDFNIEMMKVSLNQFYFYNKLSKYCKPEICRQGKINNVVSNFRSQGGDVISSNIPLDYFF